MADNDITIGIKTTGADTAAADILKVQEAEKQLDQTNVKIIDTTVRDTAEIENNKTAFAAWQAERMAAHKEAGASALAYSASIEKEIQSDAQAAAAASNLAAAEEAAAVRRGLAAKAASEAIEIEAKKVLASRLKEAEAEAAAQAAGQKKLANAAVRALTPRNRELSAGMSVANSPAALEALGGLAAPAAIAAIGVDFVNSTVKAVKSLQELNQTAKDTGVSLDTDFVAHAEAAIEGFTPLHNAVNSVKEGFGDLWKIIKDPIGEWTGINDLAKGMQQHLELLEKIKAKESENARSHAEMNQKILDSDLKLRAAQSALERGREQRAGTSADQSAANEIARVIQRNATEHQKIIDAIAEAKRVEDEALDKMNSKTLSDATKVAASNTYDAAKKSITDLQLQFQTKIQTDGLDLKNRVEDAQKKSTDGLEQKLTDNAKGLQSQLQAIVDKNGPATDENTRQALAKINAVLADGKVTFDEAKKLDSAAIQFQQSADSNQDGLRQSAQKLRDSNQAAIDAYKKLNDQVAKTVEIQNQSAHAADTTAGLQPQIAANVKKVDETAGKVATAQTESATHTEQAIQTLAPKPQDTEAIVAAVKGVQNAIGEQGDAIIAALAAAQAGMGQVVARINQQQSQIETLFARLR